MVDRVEKCSHLEGFSSVAGASIRCRVCGETLNVAGVERWVRNSERMRDEVYLEVEGDEPDRALRDGLQREVYRRRKVLYELREWGETTARPEMLLVVYSPRDDRYECRVFYKGAFDAGYPELFVVGASSKSFGEMLASSDPTARLVGSKVREFDLELRKSISQGGAVAWRGRRRVFYASELS